MKLKKNNNKKLLVMDSAGQNGSTEKYLKIFILKFEFIKKNISLFYPF